MWQRIKSAASARRVWALVVVALLAWIAWELHNLAEMVRYMPTGPDYETVEQIRKIQTDVEAIYKWMRLTRP